MSNFSEYGMRYACVDIFRALFFQKRSGTGQGPRSLGEIVYEHDVLALDVTDHTQGFGLGRTDSALGHDRQGRFKGLSVRRSRLQATDVRGNNDQVIQTFLLNVPDQNRGCIEVVDRNVEKPLNLLCMKVDRENPFCPGGSQKV